MQDNTNLTAIQDIADLSYDQVQERYGSRLRIIASARLQDEQLFLGIPVSVAFVCECDYTQILTARCLK